MDKSADKIVPLQPNAKQREAQANSDKPLKERIVEALKTVYDPEIPVNIYDLGLIYDIEISAEKAVHINMTLTAPGCPVAGSMPGQVRSVVQQLPDVGDVDVELVWDPPWTKERMSEEAKLILDMF
jgi:FeS assembly SUF system protein